MRAITNFLCYGRFSGITEEDMKDVTTTILDVQATLLTMFSDKTILVGHSLESDFKALRLLHDTVVDTSVMFPHKNGYPQKRALKNLCSEYLRKIIQNDSEFSLSKKRERRLKGENDKIYDKIISNNNFYCSWWS